MNVDTMVALAVDNSETREELLELAWLVLAFAGVAHVVGDWSLRDRLVERATDVLAEG